MKQLSRIVSVVALVITLAVIVGCASIQKNAPAISADATIAGQITWGGFQVYAANHNVSASDLALASTAYDAYTNAVAAFSAAASTNNTTALQAVVAASGKLIVVVTDIQKAVK
jgi:hypothetical protein